MSEVKRQIVIFSGFNRAKFSQLNTNSGAHKTLTEEWISLRAKIWKNYTWRSIQNQTYRNWVYCLCCDPAGKKITDKYFGDIKDSRFFLTYSETQQERDIMKILAAGKDEIVDVRIDSDDMLHPKAIQELVYALYDTSYNWFLWRKGYGYQYREGNPMAGKLKRYVPRGSGPFYAHRYVRPQKWINKGIIKEIQHQWVIKKMPKLLKDDRVIVGVYGNNTSTHFSANYFKHEITGQDKEDILKGFKIL